MLITWAWFERDVKWIVGRKLACLVPRPVTNWMRLMNARYIVHFFNRHDSGMLFSHSVQSRAEASQFNEDEFLDDNTCG